MESSSCCIEEPCSDAEQRHPPPPAEPLQRVGSGASVVLDPDTTTGSSIEAESRKLTSSQYKGVVAQPNGRWGAQIYEKHQRVWLGTFNEEADAARAYDVAAQRFRGRDAVTNFKPLSGSDDSDVAELDFLSSHSKSEVVDMLRKHTYADELLRRKRTLAVNNNNSKNSSNSTLIIGFHLKGSQGSGREHLFDKTVTPSDVGKLNRLVIPKQHAEKHFPLQISGVTGGCKGVLLNFEDGSGKVWRFRYSYWNSSQSYVLTKGWSRFVKEKSLQAGDVVTFQRSKVGDDRREEKHLFIQCRPRPRPVQVLRLFGVNIFKMPAAVENTESDWNSNGKRSSRDLNYEHQFFKKQCVASL